MISADSLSALNGSSRSGPTAIPFASPLDGVGPAAASAGAIPLDPFTGLPRITSRVQIELVAARALYAWNLQVIAALRGEDALGIGFTASSLSSIETVDALIQGASFEDAGRPAAAPAYTTAGLGDILGVLLNYFSPAASALRMVGYGAELLGTGSAGPSGDPSGGGLGSLLVPAVIAGTNHAGAGAPSAVFIALQRTESFSLRALDLYAEGYSLPGVRGSGGPGGYGTLTLSTLDVDFTSESSIFAVYFGPGADPGEYTPLDLYA